MAFGHKGRDTFCGLSQPRYFRSFASRKSLPLDSLNKERKRARRGIDEASAAIQRNTPFLEVLTKIVDGSPKDVILQEAADWGADLIMMGSHGYGEPCGFCWALSPTQSPCMPLAQWKLCALLRLDQRGKPEKCLVRSSNLSGFSLPRPSSRPVIAIILKTAETPQKLAIAATIFRFYDMVRNLTQNEGDVQLIVPPGASTHFFEPSSRDLQQLQGVKIVFTIGQGRATQHTHGIRSIQIIPVDRGVARAGQRGEH